MLILLNQDFCCFPTAQLFLRIQALFRNVFCTEIYFLCFILYELLYKHFKPILFICTECSLSDQVFFLLLLLLNIVTGRRQHSRDEYISSSFTINIPRSSYSLKLSLLSWLQAAFYFSHLIKLQQIFFFYLSLFEKLCFFTHTVKWK